MHQPLVPLGLPATCTILRLQRRGYDPGAESESRKPLLWCGCTVASLSLIKLDSRVLVALHLAAPLGSLGVETVL